MAKSSNVDRKTQSSREVVEKAIAALNRGDGAAFIGAFSDDLDFNMPGSTPVSGHTHGIQEFTALVGKVAGYVDVPITIKVTNFIACGEWVVTESDGHAVTKSGKDYNNHYCHLWQVRNGKIVKFVEYNDTELIMRVLCA